MSKAVPWSGLVRTSGSPSVTFTPFSTPRYFTGIRPWSWYIATTTSNSPRRAAHEDRVGREGTVRIEPGTACAARTAGAMVSISSRPNRPPSPACGFSPATAMRGRRPSAR
jgi:hypothetical protein